MPHINVDPLPEPRAVQRPTAVFMGSPEFAVPSLDLLLTVCQVLAVFTQPDRPAGRGRRLQAPPVKLRAERLGLPVHQPASLRKDASPRAVLSELNADVFVVAAYGLLLPPEVLGLPPHGALNVHASLLPRWRGAAPVAHAMLAGDAQVGATIMLMEAGLDTGPILAQRAMPWVDAEGCGAMTTRLATLGAQLLAETLPRWLAGDITPRPQGDEHATYAPRLTKADGLLNWDEEAAAIVRRVRAMDPWPGAFSFWSRGRLKVLAAVVRAAPSNDLAPGKVILGDEGPLVVCRDGAVLLQQVQAEGGRVMSGSAFLLGSPDLVDQTLGDEG